MLGPIPVFGRPRPLFSVPAIASPLEWWYQQIIEPEQGGCLVPALTTTRLGLGGEGWLLTTITRRGARC